MIRNNPEKEKLVNIVARWRHRSRLNFRQIVARIQEQGVDLSETVLRDYLTGRLERAVQLSPELTLAVIAAFTERLTDSERCRLDEAIEFADLARLPLRRFPELASFFPGEDFRAVLGRYLVGTPVEQFMPESIAIILDLVPEVKLSRLGSNLLIPADCLMPLCHDDIIYTNPGAGVVFFCKETKWVVQIEERRVQPVTCEGDIQARRMTRLDWLDEEAGPVDLNKIEVAIRKLALSAKAQQSLLALLYRDWQQWAQAARQLMTLHEQEGVDSAYLWLQLGDLYFELADHKRAEQSYQAALERAAGADDLARDAARIGLARLASAESEVANAVQQLDAVMDPAFIELVGLWRLALLSDSAVAEGQPDDSGLTLTGLVRRLAGEIAPQLTEELGRIPESFLKRLAELKAQAKLQPGQLSGVYLGSDRPAQIRAMETMAATYLTTDELVGSLSVGEIKALIKSGRLADLSDIVYRQALQAAQAQVGLDAQEAEIFARAYTDFVINNLDWLRGLLKS